MNGSILVLGVGNPLLEDEGVGVVALAELGRRYRFPSEVSFLEGGTAGLSLLAEIAGVEKLLVLDAVQAGAAAGTLTAVDGNSVAPDLTNKLSPHQIGLGDMLAAARLLAGPKEVVILGVEPASMSLRVGLSAPVAGAVPDLVEAAAAQLASWGFPGERITEPGAGELAAGLER